VNDAVEVCDRFVEATERSEGAGAEFAAEFRADVLPVVRAATVA
jgi:hypothetical protein